MFSEEDAAAVARELFGVEGVARAVDSERDQAWLIDAHRATVLKISNAAEDPQRLDLEAMAAQRVAQLAPDIPVAQPWLVPGTHAYRAPVHRGADTHYARMYDLLPGRAGVRGDSL